MKPWTEAHQREALRRTYEIAAELVVAGRADEASYLVIDVGVYVVSEWKFRLNFRNDGGSDGPGFDDVRINREVRRVRALAEGRLVREHDERFYVRRPTGDHSGVIVHTMSQAKMWADDRNANMGPEAAKRGRYAPVRVSVTRIRRA